MRFLALLLSSRMFVATKALAQSYYDEYCEALGTYCGSGQGFVSQLAVRVVSQIIVPLGSGIAVIAIIYGGVRMAASAGNDQGKEEAKKIIMFGLTGLVLLVVGVSIVAFVCNLTEAATGGSGLCTILG